MKLSKLQQYIVKQSFLEGKSKKEAFLPFYASSKVKKEVALKDIVKSMDRLVTRDLAKSEGVKTAQKWYTKSITLTAKGRKLAVGILSKQGKLPFKKNG